MKLFEPGQIGKLRIKNRIVMAPMGLRGLIEPDGRFSERAIDYYVARAKGGCGLIVSCVAFPDQEGEPHLVRDIWSIRPRLDSFMYVSRLSELVDRIHHYGCKLAIQLSAGFGRVASPSFLALGQPTAPSPVPCFWKPDVTARELPTGHIAKIVKAFEVVTETLKAAGVDAIEIHGHEGYLLDQFTTSLWNKRTDRYGGSLENRLRFSLEIIKAIKSVAGIDFPVIYRYGLKHYLDGGREIDEGLEIAKLLEEAGVDCLDVDAGCYETWYWPHPPVYQPSGCMVDMAEAVKKEVKIPIMAVGKLGYPKLAEKVLEEGKADFIALGRALLADADWANKVREGREEDITPCIGCHEGCLHRANAENKYTSCAVNPMAGMEREYTPNSATMKKQVLIIGGGPAGLEAARVAALRGHNVRLYEMSDQLGGNLIPASVPGFKKDLRDFLIYLRSQIKKLGVVVVLNKKVTANFIIAEKPEIVIIATGSAPITIEIPGLSEAENKGRALKATDFLREGRETGESVVIGGGGFIGCEVGVYLAGMGKKVTIIEMTKALASGMPVSNRLMLLKMLSDNRVNTVLDAQVVEITAQGALVNVEGKQREIKANNIIFALGMTPRSQLGDELEGKVPHVSMIGDCAQPGNVLNAVWGGFHAARII